jgi:hypothetical protein
VISRLLEDVRRVHQGLTGILRILTEQLNMHRIAVKFVLRVLTVDQKDSRVAICLKLKETVRNDPTLLLNLITGDECIVYAYDPETKLQSSQWKSLGSPRPKQAS